MSNPLWSKRMDAALITRGISTDAAIHGLVLKICEGLNLGGDLLEFGAGTGQLANHLVAAGYRGVIRCADIQPRPADVMSKIEWLQADLNHPLPVPDQSFDTILSTEVIEHLENPRFVFREFYRLLRPKGTVVITTPNQESIRSLMGLLFGGHFTAFLGKSYPAHISALLQLDFKRICSESGFTPPRFDYTDSGVIPKLTHIRWQEITFGLLKGKAFSDNVAVVTTKP
jgi:2-polyprenyl-3-methyl-5-hydroxy-6-metoxy-1,4-benzoquinol methylase